MDEIIKWVNELAESDNICAQYYDKILKAKTKKNIVDVAIDSNGCGFLCEMESKGMLIPYFYITSAFPSFINGKYTSFHSTKGNVYTSQIYCCYQGKIDMSVTLLTLLGCTCSVYVSENHICQIYLDKNCDVNIACPSSSKAIVHYWGDKEPEYSGNVEFVKES